MTVGHPHKRNAASLLSVLVFAFVLASAVRAAPTAYRDDFSGDMRGWAESQAYTLTQEEGVLRMQVSKQTKWEGQYLHLGEKHDFAASPYVNLKVRSDTPCILHVYFHDGEANDLRHQKVRVVDGFVTLCYDFSDAEKVDLTGVQGMIFAVNGAANSWDGTLEFEQLVAGDEARPLAGIEGVADRVHYRDSGRQNVLLTGIQDASGVAVSGGEGLIRDARVSAIEDGRATLSYEVVPGVTGWSDVFVTAQGEGKFRDNSVSFTVNVEDNQPPTLDVPSELVVRVGEENRVQLSGISDGNVAAEQPLTFSVTSSDESVLPSEQVAVRHAPGSPYATLVFTGQQWGETQVNVTVDDGAGGDSSAEATMRVRVVPEWNNPPTLDPVDDMMVFTDAGRQEVKLTGISAGEGEDQPIEITATSTDRSVVDDVQVAYDGGSTATLSFTPDPDATGTTRIDVTVRDRGGSPRNNGDSGIHKSFNVTTRVRPRTALRMDFSDREETGDRWRTESGLTASHATVDGEDVLEVECRDKVTFGGLWLTVPDLDLSEYPYLTVDVKPEERLQFNMYFYDGNERRNSGASQTTTIEPDRWQTVTFDFSGPDQMVDNQGQPVKADWIQQVLFNFHPKLDWPFTRYNGTLYFRNLRIGRAADVPEKRPVCTIDDVADQVHLVGAGRQEVTVTGIGDGAEGPAQVSASASDDVLAGLAVSEIADGTATVSYNVGSGAGAATVELSVTAEGSDPAGASFRVDVLDDDPAEAVSVEVDCSERHQRIYGFGTFSNQLPVELYAGELGASAMRVGLIANQIEPSNDNWDASVLYRGGLNYDAFNFEHYRRLHEAGVETFILTSWSPPAWMKANLSLNYQQAGFQGDSDQTLNRLDYYRYEEFAESMVAAVRMFQEEAGIDLTAIGLQNEPAFHEPYASAILDPQRFVELIKVVGRRFEEEGIDTRLFMPEQVFTQYRSMHQYIDALNADPEAQRYCDIIAVHGYDPTGVRGEAPKFPEWEAMYERAQRGGVPKEMWMTETGMNGSSWGSAMGIGRILYGSLEYGNMGLWTSWSIEGQLVRRSRPNPGFYAASQFYRHIRPGAVRVASTSSSEDVLVTSYVKDADHGGGVATVLINESESARAVRLSVSGRPAPRTLDVSRSDRVRRHDEAGRQPADDLILLPPRSITTVVGER
ncbi:MAG: glycoside hydrolase family 30 beta sandwich domain-containing protein [Candidatus Brocadiia bacterium]